MDRLFQDIGNNPEGTGKRVEGTDTFFVIHYHDIPSDRRTEITYTSVIYEVRQEKEDPNRTRITILGNRICYPGDVGTTTAALELFKLLINSILSHKGARFVCFNIKNVYLCTPLDRPKYVLEVNAGILGAIERCAEVKNLDVKAHEACTFAG